MSVTEPRVGIRLSDPPPAYCSACFGSSPETRFVDLEAACDRGQMIREENGVVHERELMDDLHLCETCVKEAAEALGFRPELHRRQLRQTRQAGLRAEHFKASGERKDAVIESLQATISELTRQLQDAEAEMRRSR